MPLPASCALSLTSPHLRSLPSASVTRPLRYYEPLRHPARPGLSLAGFRFGACTPPAGLPVLLFPSSSMRASANTPAETTGACVARFPVAASLPRYNGGSASAACFSRPARRLLAFSPASSLNRLMRPFDARVLQSISLPPRTALAATNRSDSCCAGFAPARRKRLSTAHVESRINPWDRRVFGPDYLVTDWVGKRKNLGRARGRRVDQPHRKP